MRGQEFIDKCPFAAKVSTYNEKKSCFHKNKKKTVSVTETCCTCNGYKPCDHILKDKSELCYAYQYIRYHMASLYADALKSKSEEDKKEE